MSHGDESQRLAYLFWVVLALALLACLVCMVCYAMRCFYKWVAVAVVIVAAVFLAFGTALVLANL